MEKIVFTNNETFEFYFKHNGVRVSVSTGANNILLRYFGQSNGYMIDGMFTHRDIIDILDQAEKSRDWNDFQMRTGLITKNGDHGYWHDEMQFLTESNFERIKRQIEAWWYRITTPKQHIPEDPAEEESDDEMLLEDCKGLQELKKELG